MNIFKSCLYHSETLPNTRNKWFLTCYASSMTSILAPAFLGGSKMQRSTCQCSAKRKLLPCSVSKQVSTTGKEVCVSACVMCECVCVNALANCFKNRPSLRRVSRILTEQQWVLFRTQLSTWLFVFFWATRCSLSHKVTSVQGQWAQHLNLMKSPFSLFLWLIETLVSLYNSCSDCLF